MKMLFRILSIALVVMCTLLTLVYPVWGIAGIALGVLSWWYSGRVKTSAQIKAEAEEREQQYAKMLYEQRAQQEAIRIEEQERRVEEKRQKLKEHYDILMANPVYIDTETTGLHSDTRDELLSLAILDHSGNILFDHLFKPEHRRTWKEAQEINGISPEMVKKEKPFQDYVDEVQRILNNASAVVGYNLEFDLGFLQAGGVKYTGKTIDVMSMYTTYMVNTTGSRERRWSLRNAASHMGWDWKKEGSAHSAVNDAKATRFVLLAMLSDNGLDYE
ncbi:MAG: hypothetical protein IKE36_09405 [Solobacterium sp.]|nr:hypothetical protein [Solobacterium sp.]